ncbi:sensor histidine kinase [Parachryseolinea silvisoli]|uniref:sensor histidine kinase n=1 Tax=Parachryseolinea silvisoli TaxID=2873601 RepID=UPI002265A992|nr:ATP-binding protein [Parachryseolinea silvisoli]MCD9013974.1 PAS domain S-box protein [Parachryseolinea silvisoli]
MLLLSWKASVLKILYQPNTMEKIRAVGSTAARKEVIFQNSEKEKRAAELVIANTELIFQNGEKEKRAAELIVANRELLFQNKEKEDRAAELILANQELVIQNQEKEHRAAELIIANRELAFQNTEKEKRAAELVIANTELAYQNGEKEKRAAELIIANQELVIQNAEKEKRAADLVIANIELAYQNAEKEKRAAELSVANTELAYQNREKEKRATELIITNHELAMAEEQFRQVVESSPNAIVVINVKGLITLVNNQTEKLFEYDRDELIGNKAEMLMPERFRDQYSHHRAMFFNAPQTRSVGADHELYALSKSGTEIQVEIGLNPIETVKGKKILVSIIDITERKAQEVMLIKHNKELEQFAYVASHDLQEPLRTVANYMDVFETDYLPLLDDKARQYIKSVTRATERMSMLIKSLLAFSRLGHNKVLVSVDCNDLVADVLDDLATVIEKSDATICISPLPVLNLYEVEMRQVFQNLITNAIKFMKKHAKPKIEIGAEQIKDRWRFSIRDNGIGIAANSFDRVFDIFQRLHTSKTYEGSGIGLANCKKIIQLHGGDISIESTLGKGTTFYFDVPILTK